jgi:hypothetical protein
MGLRQDPLGEINPFVQVGYFLPQSIDLGQELGILHRLGPPSEPVGQSLSHRAHRKEEEGSSSEDQNDGEYPFYIHGFNPNMVRAAMSPRWWRRSLYETPALLVSQRNSHLCGEIAMEGR